MKLMRPSLRGVVLGLAAGLVTGQVALAHAEDSQQAVATAVSAQEISISSYNVRHTLSADRAVADIKELAARSDIVTLQEMSSGVRRREVRASLFDCSMCPFEGYLPTPAVPGATPILYRWDRFRVEGSGTVQVTEDTYVGPAGSGPATLRAKYLNWVKLRERATGQSLYVINNHTVPTVQGKGGGPNRRFPERLALYRQHMTGLTALITGFKQDGSLVFVTGDFNVNYRRDVIGQWRMFPYARLGAVGVRASYQALGQPARGTHVLRSGRGDRLIDYVWYLEDRDVTPVSQRILRGYDSDHRPVVVSFRLSAG